MPEDLTVSLSDIIEQVKLSCQIPSIVEAVVTHKIIALTAKAAGIIVEPDELQQAADSFRLKHNLQSAEETWLWLQKHHLSVDNLEEIAYATILSSKLAQHLFADKVEPYFVEHQLDYAQVFLYEVILDNLDLAMELFYALQEREITFSEVAYQYIQDPESRRCGGYRGMVPRTHLKPEISAAIFAATPPQILRPIVVSKKAYLLFVEKIVQPKLDDELFSTIQSELFTSWLRKQVETSKVTVTLNLAAQ
jgi:parvulin-like peptidyl-prolyl isomerase